MPCKWVCIDNNSDQYFPYLVTLGPLLIIRRKIDILLILKLRKLTLIKKSSGIVDIPCLSEQLLIRQQRKL